VRAIRIFRAADLVWGQDNDRIVKVLAGQATNDLVSRLHAEVIPFTAGVAFGRPPASRAEGQ
jgi:hypothetical protein